MVSEPTAVSSVAATKPVSVVAVKCPSFIILAIGSTLCSSASRCGRGSRGSSGRIAIANRGSASCSTSSRSCSSTASCSTASASTAFGFASSCSEIEFVHGFFTAN